MKYMKNGTLAKETISALKEISELVSDNGTLYNSNEFVNSCQANLLKLLNPTLPFAE